MTIKKKKERKNNTVADSCPHLTFTVEKGEDGLSYRKCAAAGCGTYLAH
jgi:hypothetical protein